MMLIGQVGATGTPTPTPTPIIGDPYGILLAFARGLAILLIAYFVMKKWL